MYTRCPHCNQKFQIEPEFEGEEILCSKCQQAFPAVPAVFCEACGTLEAPGKEKCSSCGTRLLDLKHYRKRENILRDLPPLEWEDEDDSAIYSVSKFTRGWIRIWAALGMVHAIWLSIAFLVAGGVDASLGKIVALSVGIVCFIGISGTVYVMMYDSAMPHRVIYWTPVRKLWCIAFAVFQILAVTFAIRSWQVNEVPTGMRIAYIVAILLWAYTLYLSWRLFSLRAAEQEHEIGSPVLALGLKLVRRKRFWYMMAGVAVILVLLFAASRINSYMGSPEYQYGKWSSSKTEKNLAPLKKSVAQGYLPAIADYAAYAEQKDDYAVATAMWRKLADAGNDSACYKLGMAYVDGLGIEQNNGAAIVWLRKAAEAGHPEAPAPLGRLLYEEKEYREAMKWLREAADFGNIKAKYYIGLAYLHGNGISKDPRSSVQLFKEAAERNLPEAQLALGECLLNGTGCPQDVPQGAKLIMQAAENNFPQAQYQLGVLYENGEGLEKSAENAFKWYQAAAKLNSTSARVAVASAYLRGMGVAQDVSKGMDELTHMAQQNNPEAQFILGGAYYTGVGEIAKNPEECFKWIQKAAESNYSDAVKLLGLLYLEGVGCKKNPAKAMEWWKKAAQTSPEIARFVEQYERNMKYDRLVLIKISSLRVDGATVPAVLQYLQEKMIADSSIKFTLPNYISSRLSKVPFFMLTGNKDLLHIIDAVCLVGELKFSLKNNNVIFESDFNSRKFSQTTSNFSETDATWKKLEFQVNNGSKKTVTNELTFLANILKDSAFTVIWKDNENYNNRYVSIPGGKYNLLNYIQELCKQSKLKFTVSNNVIFFQ